MNGLDITPGPIQRRIEVGELLPGEGPLALAVDIFLPWRVACPPVALFCLPGGALSRRYYDLNADPGLQPQQDGNELSFARQMAARGFIVVTVDHLGVGDSSHPRDGFELTPDILTAANSRVLDILRADFLTGRLPVQREPQMQPLTGLLTVGVGHSMGAMLTAMQQARYRQHAALMLYGFSTMGLVAGLSADEAVFADDPAGARGNVVRLARARGSDPYPQLEPSRQGREIFAGENADRRAVEALKPARTGLLLTAGLFSMIPRSCAPECAQVDVPVFLALGDRDIAGPPHQIPANFPASRDITLLILPATGHSHFLFATRRQLVDRSAAWVRSAVAPA